MKKISIVVLLVFIGISSFAQLVEINGIPRDTSFTPYSACIKLKNNFPQIEVVKAKLPDNVKAIKDIVYATLPKTKFGERKLHLDLFQPKAEGKYPLLILIFGGGWRSGSKDAQVPMAQQIASKGYVTAAIEYRLSPEELYPAAVYDIKAAIRFLKQNAKQFNINAEKVAVTGSSAGGQLAALVGMTAHVKKFDGYSVDIKQTVEVQAIIDMDGVLDFTDPNESAKDDDPKKRSAGAYWFGATYKEAPDKWVEASPMIYAGEDTPPILFINSALPRFHAGRDQVIETLNSVGVYSEVHTIPETPHPFWLFHPWFNETVGYMVEFLERTLKE